MTLPACMFVATAVAIAASVLVATGMFALTTVIAAVAAVVPAIVSVMATIASISTIVSTVATIAPTAAVAASAAAVAASAAAVAAAIPPFVVHDQSIGHIAVAAIEDQVEQRCGGRGINPGEGGHRQFDRVRRQRQVARAAPL